MPFAEAGGGITLPLEQTDQRRLRRINEQRRHRGCRPPDVLAEWIRAREQRIARRGADRRDRVRIGEAPALAGKPVDVRRLHVRRAVADEVAIAEVIGKDEDNVGFGFFRCANADEHRKLHDDADD